MQHDRDYTRPRLKRLVRFYADTEARLPSTLVLARTLGVTSWTIQHHLGRMHDAGQINLVGAGARRRVVFPDGKATA